VIILNNQQRKEEIKNKLLKIENFYDDCSLNLDDLDNIFLKITDKKFTNEDPRINRLIQIANSFIIKAPKKNIVKIDFILDADGVESL
jgi:hypothetical protein